MAKREIGTKLVLDGEAEFKSAVKSINQDLRVMVSEMAAVTSGFDKNGASLSDLKAKNDVYDKQISAQKQKLSEYQSMLKKAKESQDKAAAAVSAAAAKYGEQSKEVQKAREALAKAEEKVADYQIGVNYAVSSLNKMKQAQKENNEQVEKLNKASLDKLKSQFKAVADAVGKTASAVAKFSVKTVTDSVQAGVKAFSAYTAKVTAAATAAAVLVTNSAQAAQEIQAMSQRVGFSTEAYQEWEFIAAKAGTSMETLQGGITDLAEKMDDAATGEGEAAEIFDQLGISVTDSTGKLKNQEQMFEEVVVALQNVEDASKRQALATKLMSTTGEELLPLLNGEIGSVEDLKNKASELGVVTETETLNGLIDFKSSLDDLQLSAKSAGNILAGSFVPMFQQFTDIISTKSVGIIKDIAAIFSGKGADGSGLTQKLKDLGNGLTSALSEMLPKFTKGFSTVFLSAVESGAAILPGAVNDLLPMALSSFTELVTGLVSNIPTLVPTVLSGAVTLFSGILNGLNEVSLQLTPMIPGIVQSIVDALSGAGPQLITGAVQLFAGLATGISEALPEILPAVVGLIPVIVSTITDNIGTLIDAAVAIMSGLADGIIASIPILLDMLPEIVYKLVSALMEEIPTLIESLNDIIGRLTLAIWDAVPAMIEAVAGILVECGKAIKDNASEWFSAFEDIGAGIYDRVEGIKQKLKAIWDSIIQNIKDAFAPVFDIGKNIIEGIADGITEGVKGIGGKINDACNSVVDGVKDFFGIHSPSTVFRDEVGTFLAEGLGAGFTEQMQNVSKDMKKAVPTTFDLDVDVNTTARRKGAGSSGPSENSGGNSGKSINIYQYNTSPEPIDAASAYRHTRQALTLANTQR